MTKYLEENKDTAEEIASEEELARTIAERVLRSHRHSSLYSDSYFVFHVYMRLLITDAVTIACHT